VAFLPKQMKIYMEKFFRKGEKSPEKLLLLLLTANGFSTGGSGTTIRQQTNNTLTTITQHTI
jgi:hypothetical protein